MLRLSRLSTGWRLFIILIVVLLPLAILAALATKQISENADLEREMLVRQALEDSAKRIASRIEDDLAQLRVASSELALGNDPVPICSALRQEVGRADLRISAVVYGDGTGVPACSFGGFVDGLRERGPGMVLEKAELQTDIPGVIVGTRGRVAAARAFIYYPVASLMPDTGPFGEMPVSELVLSGSGRSVSLGEVPERWQSRLNASMTADTMVMGLNLSLRFIRTPRSSPEFLAQTIPFLTVLAAALIGWLVVNRMLISPVTRLQRKMSHYHTGERLSAMQRSLLNASEIEDLDSSFLALTNQVADDKQALDQGLEKQIGLTREVHHRVKNNLQIVASLISLHARTADSNEARFAYAKIQRRVDALAMVQRNQPAATEEQNGISLRALVGELAGSFQAEDAPGTVPLRVCVSIDNIRVLQDVAAPIAFLLTELLELIALTRPGAEVEIQVDRIDAANGEFDLRVRSDALADNADIQSMLDDGIDRVLQGLIRQLRSRLEKPEPELWKFDGIALFDSDSIQPERA